jgi:drug/metabolite transporter (DMT)-like permease
MGVYARLLLTAMFWGGTFVAGRVVAGEVGPFSVSFLRFLAASVCLFVLVRVVEGRWPRVRGRQIVTIILLGLTGVAAYNIFFLKGLRIIPASRASLIVATCPVFITVFSALIFKEQLTWVRSLGVVLSVTGAAVVVSGGNPLAVFNGAVGAGEALILGCVLMWTAYSLIGKAAMRELSALVLVAYSSGLGALLLLAPACLEGMLGDMGHYSAKSWLCILYLGLFGTVLGFLWYYQGVKAIGAMKAGLFINFVPVWGVILAYLILDERLTGALLVGAVLVVWGVYLVNRSGVRREDHTGGGTVATVKARGAAAGRRRLTTAWRRWLRHVWGTPCARG